MPNDPYTLGVSEGFNEDYLRVFLDNLFGQNLGQPRRPSLKRSPTPFRKGFRKFSQRHRWERKYYRRSCLACNAQFVVKKESAVPTPAPTPPDDLWQDIPDCEEGIGEGSFAERSDMSTELGDLADGSETGSEAADEQTTDNETEPGNLEGFCPLCQALRSTPDHSTPLLIATEEAEPPAQISEVATQAFTNGLSSGNGLSPRNGLGNIPTLEEAIRRQRMRVGHDDDPEPESLWKTFFKRAVETLPRLIGMTVERIPRMIIVYIIVDGIFWAMEALFTMFPLDLDRYGLRILLELFDEITFRLFHFAVRWMVDFSIRQLISWILGAIKFLGKMAFQLVSLVGAGLVFSIAAGLQLLDDCIYFLRKCTFPNAAGISYPWVAEMTGRIRYDIWSDRVGISGCRRSWICN